MNLKSPQEIGFHVREKYVQTYFCPIFSYFVKFLFKQSNSDTDFWSKISHIVKTIQFYLVLSLEVNYVMR